MHWNCARVVTNHSAPPIPYWDCGQGTITLVTYLPLVIVPVEDIGALWDLYHPIQDVDAHNEMIMQNTIISILCKGGGVQFLN